MTDDIEILTVQVVPKAKQAMIKEEVNANGETVLKIYVTVVPENGKANKAVIEALSKHLKIAKSKISVIKGETSRTKTIRIDRG